jgi:hypothetical protein
MTIWVPHDRCETSPRCQARRRRDGTAAAELAVLLPFLAFLVLVTVEFAQVFFHAQTIEHCARNGATFGCQVFNSNEWQGASTTKYDSIVKAALADGSSLDPPLNDTDVAVSYGQDDGGHDYVEVQVQYVYKLGAYFETDVFNLGKEVDLTRKVRMRLAPTFPSND